MKKRRVVILWGCLCFSCRAGAQVISHVPVDNAYLNSGAYSSHYIDAFSFTGNIASLPATKNTMAGMLSERKWMLKELDNYMLASVFSMGKDAIGLLLQQSGDADYREQKLALAYGKNLGHVDIGVQFGFLQESLNGYHGYDFGNAGLGIRMQMTSNLTAGWEMNLPVFGKSGELVKENAPQIFRMGFGYEWGTDLFFSVQIIKTGGLPVNVISSMMYRFAEQFFFSFGINSNEGSPIFMSGWEKNQITIQMYAAFEPVLGFSPGLVVLWKNKRKKQ